MHQQRTSQSIDQEMSTKSRIMLSNCTALLIFVEITAKLDRLHSKRFCPQFLRKMKNKMKVTFLDHGWKLCSHRIKWMMMICVYPVVGFSAILENWPTFWYLRRVYRQIPKILSSSLSLSLSSSNRILSMITWTNASAMAIPISQYNGYSSIDWQIEYAHSTITCQMKANDLIFLGVRACNPEMPLIRKSPLFKLVLLKLNITAAAVSIGFEWQSKTESNAPIDPCT